VNFQATISLPEFHSWRVSVRNLIDHQRRESRWWNGVHMQVWLGADGRVRGIVALDAITSEEFSEAFERWQPGLRKIGWEEVADAVLEAVRHGVIAQVDGAGYQTVRFTVRPRAVRPVSKTPVRRAALTVEPMPVLM
jgi:hypothetical protein